MLSLLITYSPHSPDGSLLRHGFIQFHTNAMDGATGLTQPSLRPGATQIYSFTADSQGVFWYHSHYKAQYVDGLKVIRRRMRMSNL